MENFSWSAFFETAVFLVLLPNTGIILTFLVPIFFLRIASVGLNTVNSSGLLYPGQYSANPSIELTTTAFRNPDSVSIVNITPAALALTATICSIPTEIATFICSK